MEIVTKQAIDRFYAHRRIAVIGASRDKRKYAYTLVRSLQARGYDVAEVNPYAAVHGSIMRLFGAYPD